MKLSRRALGVGLLSAISMACCLTAYITYRSTGQVSPLFLLGMSAWSLAAFLFCAEAEGMRRR